MNRRLAKAVVAAFRGSDGDVVRGNFAPFNDRDWSCTTEWLHTSGLALYFLACSRALGVQDVMPARMLSELEHNLLENRTRTESLFDEFVKINMEFQRAQLSYANLKGFALVPRSCLDPIYRYQHDLDFLVSWRDAERCRRVLERSGYRLSATFGQTMEFRSGEAEASSLRDLYRVRSQRSLEVHVASEQEHRGCQGDRLSRLQLQVWNGFEFSALSECDKFLAQAEHLFKHFQTEWTRAAWMLEYATMIRSYRDGAFWREVVAAIAAAPEKKLGIGVASLIANRIFGATFPDQFLACTVEELPEQVRAWVDRYEDDVVFVEFPGSKLYLLLQDVLLGDNADWQNRRRGKLLPSHLPPKAALAAPSHDIRPRARMGWARLRFIWMRLRFHVIQGVRYKIEAARWKRLASDQRW